MPTDQQPLSELDHDILQAAADVKAKRARYVHCPSPENEVAESLARGKLDDLLDFRLGLRRV